MKLDPIISFPTRTIGAHRGAILRSCGLTETQMRKMFKGRSGGQVESESIGSSWGSTWWERRQKRHKDRERVRGEEESGLGEGSDQTHRTISGVLGHEQRNGRDQELERLHRLVMDLELEARGRRQGRNRNN